MSIRRLRKNDVRRTQNEASPGQLFVGQNPRWDLLGSKESWACILRIAIKTETCNDIVEKFREIVHRGIDDVKFTTASPACPEVIRRVLRG